MGDRVNIGFVQPNGDTLYLYSHWLGLHAPRALGRALLRVVNAGRQRDAAYATRICISDIVGGLWQSDVGYGLYVNQLGDNDNDVLVVDWRHGQVHSYEAEFPFGMGDCYYSYTFDDFIKEFLNVTVTGGV